MITAEQKAKWGSGPWADEPDHVEFEAHGLPCILHRNQFGAWCGYAAVSPGHPAYGQDHEYVDVSVHGSLTYANKCAGEICHVPKPGESDDVWWLGFDCGHSGDFCPHDNEYEHALGFRRGGQYRALSYVRAETENLARQLREMALPA